FSSRWVQLTDCRPSMQNTIDSHWKIFVSRAGWSIRYPANLRISSCKSCSDLTDPNAFVTFYDPVTDQSMMIEPLAPKPNDRTVEDWLTETSETNDLNHLLTKDWVVVAGRRALKVIYRNADST